MIFAADYYDDEVRDGFYVPPIMKHCWASQIEVLKVVENICKKHDIKYYAISGTLMGAIRHGGYIPWDDDIDIGMLRRDYDKFLKVAPGEVPEHYFLRNYHTDYEFREGFTRLVNDNYVRFNNKDFLEKGHGFICTSGVDVFPLDYIPNDTKAIEKLVAEANIINSLQFYYDQQGLTPAIKDTLSSLIKQGRISIDWSKDIGEQIMYAFEKLFSSVKSCDSSSVTISYDWMKSAQDGKYDRTFSVDYFKEYVEIPFENTTVWAPKLYHDFMSGQFGNYMKPVRVCETHNFPWFKDEYELAKSHYGVEDYVYNSEALPEPDRHNKWVEETSGKLTECITVFQKASELAQQSFEAGDTASGQALLEKCQILVGNAEGYERALKGNGKRRVVFIAWKAQYWDMLDPFYRMELSQPDTEVFVIPAPYFRTDEQWKKGDAIVEMDGFPEDVVLTSYADFDFEEYRIDRIYTQNAYDNVNEAVNLYPAFFTSSLSNITDELIYVPWFELDEYGIEDVRAVDVMRFFLFVPGIVKCDKIILSGQWLKEHYVRELTKWAGEDTKDIWESKIEVVSMEDREEYKKLHIADGEPVDAVDDIPKDGCNKNLFYYIGTGQILSGLDKMLEKMKANLVIFDGSADRLGVTLYIEKGMKEEISRFAPDIAVPVDEMLSEYANRQWCTLIEAQETIDVSNHEAIGEIIDGADAFYGDAGVLMHLFTRARKPVMMQNIDIV